MTIISILDFFIQIFLILNLEKNRFFVNLKSKILRKKKKNRNHDITTKLSFWPTPEIPVEKR